MSVTSDSYWDERATRALSTMSFKEKDMYISPIYFHDDISSGKFSIRTPDPFTNKAWKLPPLATDCNFNICGDVWPILRVDYEPSLVLSLERLFLDDNILDTEKMLTLAFSKRNWDLYHLSSDIVDAYIRDKSVAIAPIVDYTTEFKPSERDIDLFNDIAKDKYTIPELSEMHGLSYDYVRRFHKHVVEKGELPCHTRKKRGSRKLPKYEEVKSMLDTAYKSQGYISRGWKGFYSMLIAKFPHLDKAPPKTIQNKARKEYKIGARKIRRLSTNRTLMQHKRAELVQALMMAKYLDSGEHVFYLDQTAFNYDPRSAVLLGDKFHVPHVALVPPKILYMNCICDRAGIVALQFTSTHATTKSTVQFVNDVMHSLPDRYGISEITLYLDNAAYQSEPEFVNTIDRSRIRLVYGIRNSPFINLAEDNFLAIKRRIKSSNPINTDQYLECLRNALISAANDPKDWILHKFFSLTLKKLQEYRELLSDPNLPRLSRTYIFDDMKLKKIIKGLKESNL